MNISKSTLESFLKTKDHRCKAFFVREVQEMFEEYRNHYRANHYGAAPNGVTLKLFKKWLKDLGYVIANEKLH